MKADISPILDLVEICARKGIRYAVVSPGSRCAPLLIGFGNHPDITTISVVDERSAAYLGMGLAQASGLPVVLVSTSGTAAANYLPAVTEAWYQRVPLIVLTADRPPEWIDQWDGQTIRQAGIYGSFVKHYFEFPVEAVHPQARWQTQRLVNEAVNSALDSPQGPVHLNVPIREPFYPASGQKHIFNSKVKIIAPNFGKKVLSDSKWENLVSDLNTFEKILIVAGQQELNQQFNDRLTQLGKQLSIPVVADVISNCQAVDNCIRNADLIFKYGGRELQPQLLITFGRTLVSKNLKLYLRKYGPRAHWHVGETFPGDVFQALTKVIDVDPLAFLEKWLKSKTAYSISTDYYQRIQATSQQRVQSLKLRLKTCSEFNEFLAAEIILGKLPRDSNLHLGNSMPVRIVNILGLDDPTIEVWSNRGTSGIDGSLSTTVGQALARPTVLQTLFIGDLAFFYDRNGLWLKGGLPANLRIVLFNNGGGGIFKMIPGPSDQYGIEELFTTPHSRTGELTAREFGLEYERVSSIKTLKKELGKFFLPASHPKLLEITTEMEINSRFYRGLWK
ncbi:MAG: 2-succinyl-5-enolpyruvyl-6-hydroxy-3-cyclohexene-1-carboxylic-acid synthase [Fidelibacterota bacterium]